VFWLQQNDSKLRGCKLCSPWALALTKKPHPNRRHQTGKDIKELELWLQNVHNMHWALPHSWTNIITNSSLKCSRPPQRVGSLNWHGNFSHKWLEPECWASGWHYANSQVLQRKMNDSQRLGEAENIFTQLAQLLSSYQTIPEHLPSDILFSR
jgi:hypothetical protein